MAVEEMNMDAGACASSVLVPSLIDEWHTYHSLFVLHAQFSNLKLSRNVSEPAVSEVDDLYLFLQ